jgi:hypothetical protein
MALVRRCAAPVHKELKIAWSIAVLEKRPMDEGNAKKNSYFRSNFHLFNAMASSITT